MDEKKNQEYHLNSMARIHKKTTPAQHIEGIQAGGNRTVGRPSKWVREKRRDGVRIALNMVK